MIEQIILSICLGALIGAEREYHKGKFGIGIRTTTFISLLGTLATYFSSIYGIFVMLITLSFVGGFAISIFWYRAKKYEHVGLTTSIATLLTFFIGSMVGLNLYKEAIAVAIIVFMLLFMKRTLVKRIKHLTDEEIINAIEFAIIAFVIYPFLPEISFYEISVKEVWEVIILVSIISFIGFLAIRKFGKTTGLILTGIFGGLYTSNATAAALVARFKKDSKTALNLYAFSIMSAIAVMLFRNFLIASIISQDFSILFPFVKYMVVLIAYLAIVFYILSRKMPKGKKNIDVESPFAIKPALVFGLVFLAILTVSKLAVFYLGAESLLPVSLLGGMVNSAGTVASASLLFLDGSISFTLFSFSIILASIGSMINAVIVSFAFREPKLAKHLSLYILGVILTFMILLML